MKNITVILPIHKINDEYQTMLDKAIMSVEQFANDVKLIIVCPKLISEKININSDLLEYIKIENKGDVDFCSQINLGIENCDTEWFSILEIDDVYRSIWLNSIYEYVKIYPDNDIFLPIVKDINSDDKFISFMNESVWAYGFTDRQGFLDNETLLDFQNYQTSGGLFKTKVIKENGSFKSNIKLTFIYEFFLRMTHNGVKIMTVPKIGYEHKNLREDSLFWLLKNDENSKLSEKEVKYWLDTAKKEFFFKNKRDVNYVEA
jgi:hypothetical protein